MNMLFLSNYYTHHQRPLCEKLYRLTDGHFTFVSTEEFSEERKELGWDMSKDVPFVEQYDCLLKENVSDNIRQADIVILGSAPLETVRERLKDKKIVLRYAERIFKSGYQPLKWFPRIFRFRQMYSRHKSMYLLSASGYATMDYGMHGAFIGKSYKWGYFPETRHYNIDSLLSKKKITRLLWCGRFLDWKHPEYAVETAKRLKQEGYAFLLDFIGTGERENSVKQLVRLYGLTDCVRFLGAMSAGEVRTHMESAGIYLFTSDFHEGWGAVLNEAMNSGCAVVASHGIGSVPFLMKHRENGLIYKNGDLDDMYHKVKYLLEHPNKQKEFGKKAYHTIVDLWNAEVAAERLLRLSEELTDHGYCDLYDDGPCSRAPFIKNNWFKEKDFGFCFLKDECFKHKKEIL